MRDKLEDYFINTPIRTSNGLRFEKCLGVPSGAYFTQLVNSVVSYILITWFSLEQFGYPPRDALYLGEHSLIGADEPWDFDLCDKLVSSIGMKLNKSKVSHNLFFSSYNKKIE